MSEPAQHLYDVFVSYAEADRGWVEGYLLDALDQASVRYHSDATFTLGVPRLHEFERALKQSRRTLLVLSAASQADHWAGFIELLAQSYGVDTQTWQVIPLVLTPVQLPSRLAMLTRLDFTDQTRWRTELERLFNELARPVPSPTPPPTCPFPGMVPFRAQDARFFHGRTDEIRQMLQHLRQHRFLFVIGPSGSGKSSLISAGLLPQLATSSYFSNGFWLVREMHPGGQPLKELAQVIGGDPARPVQALARLLTAHPPAQRLLLVVDQFEELFTQVERTEQVRFIAALNALRREARCALILALRADFYPDLMNSDLWPVDPSQRLDVGPLRREALRQAIELPTQELRVSLEAGLLERLLADAANEPGVLPLVQETMVLLWDRMERRFLPYRAYEQLGREGHSGLAVAIAAKADAVLAALSADQKKIARRIFLRLVQFGEGRSDTRRQQPVGDLRAGADDALFEKTLDCLVGHRLLTISGEENRNDKKVDIAHEALIGGWPTLRKWVTEGREAEQTLRRLRARAAEWERLKREGGWLDPVALAEADQWLSGPDADDLGVDQSLRALVQVSRDRLIQEQQRWKVLSQKYLAGRLAAEAELVRRSPRMVQRSVLLAVEAMRRWPTPEAHQALRRGLAALPRPVKRLEHPSQVNTLAFSPKGKWFASATQDGATSLWDARTLTRVREVRHDDRVNALAFSPDERWLVTTSDDATARVREVENGHLVKSLPHLEGVTTAGFTPDGAWLLTATCFRGHPGVARFWKVDGWEEVRSEDKVTAVRLHPGGQVVLCAMGPRVQVQQIENGHVEADIPHEHDVWVMDHHPWQPVIATATFDENLWLTGPTEEPNQLRCVRLARSISRISPVAFSPDGRWLAAVGSDFTVRVWDVATQKERLRLPGLGSDIGVDLVFDPSGDFLASVLPEHGAICVWDVNTGQLVAGVEQDQAAAVCFAPDGRFATSSDRNAAWIWERPAGCGDGAVWIRHVGLGQTLTFSPDGRWLAWTGGQANQDGQRDETSTLVLLEAATGVERWTVKHDAPAIKGVAFIYAPAIERVAFSSAGQWVASWCVGAVRVWDTTTGQEEPGRTQEAQEWVGSGPEPVSGEVFSPDGRFLATVTAGASAGLRGFGAIEVRDARTGHPVSVLHFEGELTALAFSSDGNWLASGHRHGTIRLWETLRGREVARVEQHQELVRALAVTPNGMLASASDDGTVRLWLVRPEDLIAEARSLLTRSLTPEEWQRYLGEEERITDVSGSAAP